MRAPFALWVNVVCGLRPRNGSGSTLATLLLENPLGVTTVKSRSEFESEIGRLFGLQGPMKFFLKGKEIRHLNPAKLASKTVSVGAPSSEYHQEPFARYVNIFAVYNIVIHISV